MNMIGAGVSRYTQPSQIADRAVMAGGLGYMGARSFSQVPAQMAGAKARQQVAMKQSRDAQRALPG